MKRRHLLNFIKARASRYLSSEKFIKQHDVSSALFYLVSCLLSHRETKKVIFPVIMRILYLTQTVHKQHESNINLCNKYRYIFSSKCKPAIGPIDTIKETLYSSYTNLVEWQKIGCLSDFIKIVLQSVHKTLASSMSLSAETVDTDEILIKLSNEDLTHQLSKTRYIVSPYVPDSSLNQVKKLRGWIHRNAASHAGGDSLSSRLQKRATEASLRGIFLCNHVCARKR